MLPETPLLQLIPARAQAFFKRLESTIWSGRTALTVEWAGCSSAHVNFEEAVTRKREPITAPFFWGDMFDQAWFRVSVPKSLQANQWYLEWKGQGEATAYIDGMPHAGLDIAHTWCPVPAGTKEVWIEGMCMESGIWLGTDTPSISSDGCRYVGVYAKHRDQKAWAFYHDFDVLFELLRDEYGRNPELTTPFGSGIGINSPLHAVNPLYRLLARRLEEVMGLYETKGLPAAQRRMRAVYKELQGSNELTACRLTGHAHLDLVWLWTEQAAECKAVHTFATANRLMDEYPEFKFGYSQPASYRAVERRSPALMKAVRKRIAAGSWEPVGAAEVECDTLLACGEALARCLLIGQEGFVDLQGHPSSIMWLPDVFGYAACLPQILSQTGVSHFFTTKLHWGSVTHFPYSSFIWRGPDGSEIVSHVSHGIGYNMNVDPGEIRAATREYRQSDIHDEFLMPSGYGDGGGGVTPTMCERARRVQNLTGVPKTAWGRIDEFFEGLDQVRERLPVYCGELYLQYHRGVYTTQGLLKESYRKAERAMQLWEAAHCATGSGPVDVEAWRRLVFTQFHDYLPGSSITRVYEEGLPELHALADRAIQSGLDALEQGASSAPCVFNPLPIERFELVAGHRMKLPPLSGGKLAELEPCESGIPVSATPNSLSNSRLKARFDARGHIRALSVDGRKVAIKDPLAQLMVFPDHPHAFEAWELDRSTLSEGRLVTGKVLSTEVASTADSASLVFVRMVTEHSKATIRYRLDVDASVMRIEYTIDWQDGDVLLKVLFPTAYNGASARFGGPYGSLLRSQQPGQPYDEAQWEVPGSRWAVVQDDGGQEGFFVVTEAKYGWSCRTGTLGLSLLRSAKIPTGEDGGSRVSATVDVKYSDVRTHHIRLAVGLFDPAAPRAELPATLADSLFTPVLPYTGEPIDAGLVDVQGGRSLIPSWAKPEGPASWTLRLHETLGHRGAASLLLKPGWVAHQVDLSGSTVASDAPVRRFTYEPYQMVSFLLCRAE